MSSGADLFVVCKQCGAEVSRYITECPYCGARIRKRAPKLTEPPRAREPLSSRRGPLRAGQGASVHSLAKLRSRRLRAPGLLSGNDTALVTLVFVIVSIVLWVLARGSVVEPFNLVIAGPLHGHWWRLFTYALIYPSGGIGAYVYAFASLGAVALFGGMYERREGSIAATALLLGASSIGALVTLAIYPSDAVAAGGNAAAAAALAAWSAPDLMRLIRRQHQESDLLGVGAFALVLLLVPAGRPEASWSAGLAGLLVGILAGASLAGLRPQPA